MANFLFKSVLVREFLIEKPKKKQKLLIIHAIYYVVSIENGCKVFGKLETDDFWLAFSVRMSPLVITWY